jgi:hypothetical protein
VLRRGSTVRTLAHGKRPAGEDNCRVMTSVRERFKALECCGDPDSLRSAVGTLCSEFGKVTKIDVFTMTEADKRRALCFLRLESAAQEKELMAGLGVARFGNDVLVIVELPAGN